MYCLISGALNISFNKSLNFSLMRRNSDTLSTFKDAPGEFTKLSPKLREPLSTHTLFFPRLKVQYRTVVSAFDIQTKYRMMKPHSQSFAFFFLSKFLRNVFGFFERSSWIFTSSIS